jgi:23S rRNA (uridine2552-2'-O)-methyltransferase
MAYKRKDAFYRRAKQSGYRSRAAYKLQDLARRYRLIRRGDHVVDLGAWPGGWLQVAAELCGRSGRVIGVDVVPVEPLGLPQVRLLRGDIENPGLADEIEWECDGRVDVVLSDVAPKLTGVRARDEVQSAALVDAAFALARRVLRPHGHMVIKVLSSPDVEPTLVEIRKHFRSVKMTRAEASRKGSAEHYLIALDREVVNRVTGDR